ncbi:MAG: hypothetical protein JXA33_17210 [Anaerolineae bacterium]|nr:hypothetical protein [Anaerolineae bacterium]
MRLKLWLLCLSILCIACEPAPILPSETSTPSLITATINASPTVLTSPTLPVQSTSTSTPRKTVTPLVTFTSTATPAPTPIPPLFTLPPSTAPDNTGGDEAGLPVIHYFRANVTEADPGDTLILEWNSEGATEAVLYTLLPSGQLPQSGWDVEPIGSYTCTIPSDAVNWSTFVLYVANAEGESVGESVYIEVHCSESWFFDPAPEVCPTTSIFSAAAEQHFEHGTMIWVEEHWTSWVDEGGWIFILYDDVNGWYVIKDTWYEGVPENDPSLVPPNGLYQPERGFGLVWRQQPDIRLRLGWAVDQETGYNTTIQQTTLFKYNSTYLRALDGNVWHLGPEQSSWDKIMTVR